MFRRIKKVAVLGSGVMGSGIACQLANAGLSVLLLDIVPRDEKGNMVSKHRNQIVENALKTAIKSKPAPLYEAKFVSRIQLGNFEDDLHKISDCDWVIEVIVENLVIKKSLFEKVERYRTNGTLITSNTSGIPIEMLVEGRSADFKENFCGTHFFNPARYMALLEIIPHSSTNQELIEFLMYYGDRYLGKKTVKCKDTPAFIANRIGFYSGSKVLELTEKYHLTIEEADSLTKSPMGWPSTGSFRLLDLVGIDTSMKVTMGVIQNCPEDEYVQVRAKEGFPEHMKFLVDNKYLGNKSGQGYYKKTNEKDANGRTVILSLDLDTKEYRPFKKPTLISLANAKKVEILAKRVKNIIQEEDKGGQFIKELVAGIMAYSANRIPGISDNIYSIDDAMRAGYAWEVGPFEFWDFFGLEEGIKLCESQGEKLPDWIYEMRESGCNLFYKSEDGLKKYFDIESSIYKLVPGSVDKLNLNNIRHKQPIYKNSECVLHDVGDGVLDLEFTSKSNAIGEGIGMGVAEALDIAENGNWKGVMIGNNAKNFTVGANLMAVGMIAMQKDFKKLEEMVKGFQDINMRMRYASVPVVTVTQGYAFGGGCEMLMHTDAAVASAESYIGLVEVGVGLIPGGGGTKEFALRASESYFEGDTKIPTLMEKLRVIATASVATSAYEAYNLGYLKTDRDSVEINTERSLQHGKQKILELSESYVAPISPEVTVLGRGGLAALYTAINEFYLGKYMSEYDVKIARKIAYVLCGGDLTGEQQVSEQYLLDIEREAFLELLGESKTLERIQYMLMNNKPLRN
ncbi:MAG: 3-hydroxyacyl-CoA dehydrogenase/enoyl-CoA hydratase family protein [Lewinellaceae bacterium]|nr:3-hydroxyacyl-CoA dehydrogenase/enoyl-CoA hydratase family protein [Lewinellaceae bacterium]